MRARGPKKSMEGARLNIREKTEASAVGSLLQSSLLAKTSLVTTFVIANVALLIFGVFSKTHCHRNK